MLLVEAANGWLTRVALQRALSRAGVASGLSPASADLVVVCGDVDDALAAALDRVSDTLPDPVAWLHLTSPDDLPAVVRRLLAGVGALEPRAAPAAVPEMSGRQAGHDMGGMAGMAGMDGMGDMMDMSGPGGVDLASGELDRDGLTMDVLHVPLGPVLAGWPAGVTVLASLQGDVVTAATVSLVGGPGVLSTRQRRAYLLDAAAQLLDLTGPPRSARRLRVDRDELLDAREPREPADAMAAWRGLRRDPVLRWALRGLGTMGADAGVLEGDVWDRLLRMVHPDLPPSPDGPTLVEPLLESVLVGLDLAAARLVITSVVALLRAGSEQPG